MLEVCFYLALSVEKGENAQVWKEGVEVDFIALILR